MTKTSPKVFLKKLWIEPTRENMIKFYKCWWTLSELRAWENYREKEYEKGVLLFKKTTIRTPKK